MFRKSWFGVLCSALATCGSLFALEDRKTPEPTVMVAPAYPQSLIKEAKPGSAKISFVVGADGKVHNAKVVSADDPAFGDSAIEALKEWEFKPVVKDGVAVDKKVTMPFMFKPSAVDLLNRALGRQVYRKIPEEPVLLKDLGQRPKPTKRSRPQYPASKKGSGEEAVVRMEFVIGPDGKTYNPDTKDEVAQEFIMAAIGAVSAMEFEPMKLKGKPVYVKMVFPVRISENPPQGQGRGGPGGGGGGGRGGPGGGGGDR